MDCDLWHAVFTGQSLVSLIITVSVREVCGSMNAAVRHSLLLARVTLQVPTTSITRCSATTNEQTNQQPLSQQVSQRTDKPTATQPASQPTSRQSSQSITQQVRQPVSQSLVHCSELDQSLRTCSSRDHISSHEALAWSLRTTAKSTVVSLTASSLNVQGTYKSRETLKHSREALHSKPDYNALLKLTVWILYHLYHCTTDCIAVPMNHCTARTLIPLSE